MKKFILPKRKYGDYKYKKSFFNAVYKLNKTRVDAVFGDYGVPARELFYQRIKEERKDANLVYKMDVEKDRKPTMYDAFKYIQRTEDFRSERERFVDNLLSGIKGNDKKVFRAIIGRNHHIEESKIRWDKEEHAYFYDFSKKVKNKDGSYSTKEMTVMITFENSPKQITFKEMEM